LFSICSGSRNNIKVKQSFFLKRGNFVATI
ncbi:TIM-barrel, nifR3 family protein, partial [Chlamydia psittaci 84-8471/1]